MMIIVTHRLKPDNSVSNFNFHIKFRIKSDQSQGRTVNWNIYSHEDYSFLCFQIFMVNFHDFNYSLIA